ncbi:MAG TPA: arginine--tRNA ligase [Dehalococcoidia bacterium]|jgi:arginyl-tRNA synthetase|nr:arginine--tRNA ligase [Dehalococcoidia bacterium]
MNIHHILIQELQNILSVCISEMANERGIQPNELPKIEIEKPFNTDHGDYASNIPLRLTKLFKNNPLTLANEIAKKLPCNANSFTVETAAPGFINFKLSENWVRDQINVIIKAGSSYGDLPVGKGTKVMIEFVSVNPTGPAHVGHARGAVLGSALANMMSAAGYSVTREYYINDAGNQMNLFYESVLARYHELHGENYPFPEKGYQGDYVTGIAKLIQETYGSSLLNNNDMLKIAGDFSKGNMLNVISEDLSILGVEFDNWFSEKSLFDSDDYSETISELKTKQYLKEMDNALWFASTLLDDDKDNVIVRTNGEPTYFASDIAYHRNKFVKRKFDRVIDIWGADHQGHISRLKAAMRALHIDDSKLTILISQMVTLKKGDEVVKASKRTGDFITVRDLVDEVGADACRYFFLARSASSQMEFDMELAKKTSNENPVHYIQYAHARITNILNLALEKNLDWQKGDINLLTNVHELKLIKTLIRLPEVVLQVSDSLEPHHMPHYALEVASSAHAFYENCRVISSDPEEEAITLARLHLLEASRIVFKKILDLMGMSAPERM